MITVDDLIELVRNYNPKTNTALIGAAFDFGDEMHQGQFRHSGEPYFTHPVAVAAILTEQQLDDATIITKCTKGNFAILASRISHIPWLWRQS